MTKEEFLKRKENNDAVFQGKMPVEYIAKATSNTKEVSEVIASRGKLETFCYKYFEEMDSPIFSLFLSDDGTLYKTGTCEYILSLEIPFEECVSLTVMADK